MAWPGGKLAKPERLQLTANRRLVEGNAELLENPQGQILQPPADHAMDRRDGAALDDRRQGLALGVVQFGGRARCLAVDQTFRASIIERENPIANRLPAHGGEPGRIGARAAIINCGQGQQAPPLSSMLGRLRKTPKLPTIKITA